jgi:fatty-acyl-CoA synthase
MHAGNSFWPLGSHASAISASNIACITAIPAATLYRLLDHPDVRRRDTGSLRALTFGGGPTALSRIKEALDVFGPVLESGYGQTSAPCS